MSIEIEIDLWLVSLEDLCRLVSEHKEKKKSLGTKIVEPGIIIRKQSDYIKQLEEEIKHLKIKPNSDNSSLPASSDIGKKPKKNRSLRTKTGKNTGGQKGHKGSNLKKVANPDNILDHKLVE